MDKYNIENTTRFKSLEEIEKYLKYLGAEEMQSLNHKTYPYLSDHVYLHHNLMYQYYKKNQSIVALGDLVDVLLFNRTDFMIVSKPWFYKYFEYNQILNLEGFIYYYMTIEGLDVIDDKDNNRRYNKILHNCRLTVLKDEQDNYKDIFNERNIINSNNSELNNNLEILSKLGFFLGIDNIENSYEELLSDIIYHPGSKNDFIKFSWNTKDLNLFCNYESNTLGNKLEINICYDDERSETFIFKSNDAVKTITYRPVSEFDNEKTYDLINNRIINSNNETRKMDDNDIINLNNMINSFSKYIIGKLPYLNEYINKKEKKLK